MFVYIIAVDLYELFENGCSAACAFYGESGGIVKVAVDAAIVFVI